jgi:hypothetical protein
MDFQQMENYLLTAVGKEKKSLPDSNPFKYVGFDGEKKRLGWVVFPAFSLIEKRLKEFAEFISGKTDFIFIGIGGSGNGIKALCALFSKHSIHTIDSLDPQAISRLLSKIKNIKKTLVIPISKSGTTKETQLLAAAFKNLFGADWQNHYLWLVDPDSEEKLNAAGWQGCPKFAIQFDNGTDIGGRFSCPGTLIFFMPLYILLKRNLKKIEKIYSDYLKLQPQIRSQAFFLADKHKNDKAYFYPQVNKKIAWAFSAWAVQLFQESLGSKKPELAVKTAVPTIGFSRDFFLLHLSLKNVPLIIDLMAQMYFFQMFTAFYAAFNNISFVTQDHVEKYKAQMRQLEGSTIPEVSGVTLDKIIQQVKAKIKPEQKFIEVVLYFSPAKAIFQQIQKKFTTEFRNKQILVFIGSDWNHHSYEAAFGDSATFFVIMLSAEYKKKAAGILPSDLAKNIAALKLISQATYLTISDKALLTALNH